MSEECHLSLQGRAFSTILTAFIGSIVTGVSEGPIVAFFIGWICWLAVVRLVLVSGVGLLVTICGPIFGFREPFLAASPTATEDDEDFALTSITTSNANVNGDGNRSRFGNQDENENENRNVQGGVAQILKSPTFSGEFPRSPAYLRAKSSRAIEASAGVDRINGEENNVDATAGSKDTNAKTPSGGLLFQRNRNVDVSILGSMEWAAGWVYKFIYTPIIQVLWISSNWSKAPSILFLARAIGLSVTALSYTIDTRARYGPAIGKKLGSKKFVPRLLNLYNAVINMMLSIIVVVLLVRSLQTSLQSDSGGDMAKFIVAPFIVFSFIWAFGSLMFLWPSDEGWNGAWSGDSLRIKIFNVLAGLFVGAFAGVFVAAPSIALWQNANFDKWGQEHGFSSDYKYDDENSKDLGAWLKCSTDQWWQKAVQVLP